MGNTVASWMYGGHVMRVFRALREIQVGSGDRSSGKVTFSAETLVSEDGEEGVATVHVGETRSGWALPGGGEIPLPPPAPEGVNVWDLADPCIADVDTDGAPLSLECLLDGAAESQGGDATGALPVGWLVVLDGPAKGRSFIVRATLSQIGKGAFQHIRLDVGDPDIARTNHATLIYDPDANTVTLGRGGPNHELSINGADVGTSARILDGDEICVGRTRLRYVALCNERFRWGLDTAPGDDDDLL